MVIYKTGFKRSLKTLKLSKPSNPKPSPKISKIPHQKAPFSNSNGIKRYDEKKGEEKYFSSLRENKILGWDLAAL